ncbi:P-loop NTPase fold protein [Bdellovibrio bacteriovorus]|uniref:P-loop NTPase fold protein n=1 Tax=Bdellovibrio bacteriovorus TaxID=959 RepID=UPI0035A571D1
MALSFYLILSIVLSAILGSAILIYSSDLLASALSKSSDILKLLVVLILFGSIAITVRQLIDSKSKLKDLFKIYFIICTIVSISTIEIFNSDSGFKNLLLFSLIPATILGLLASLNDDEEELSLKKVDGAHLDSTVISKMAELKSKMNEDNIYVIGVAGPWGIGKTNLINEFLTTHCKSDNYKVTCIDSSNYFSSESLVAELKEQYLNIFFSDNPNLFTKAAFSTLISAAPGFLPNLLNHLFSPSDEMKIKEVIKRHIQKSKKMYIIVYDDLDRLSSAEILVALRLIEKLNRIPNVKQIVLYDRSRIERILSQSGQGINSFFSKYIDFEIPFHSLDPLVASQVAVSFIKKAIEDTKGETALIHGKVDYNKQFLYLLSNYRDQIQFYYNLRTLLDFAGTRLNLNDAIHISILKTAFPVIYQDLFNEIPPNNISFYDAYKSDYGNLTSHAYKLIESLTHPTLSNRLFRFQNKLYRSLYQMEIIHPDSICYSDLEALQTELDFLSDFNFEDEIPIPNMSGQEMAKFIASIESVTAELEEKSLTPLLTLLFSNYGVQKDLTPMDLFNTIKHFAGRDILKFWLRKFIKTREEYSFPRDIREVIAAFYCLTKLYKSSHPEELSSLRESFNTYLGECPPAEVLKCKPDEIDIVFEDGEFSETIVDQINANPNCILSFDSVAAANLVYVVLTIEDVGFLARVKDQKLFDKLTNASKQRLIEWLERFNNLELENAIEIIRESITPNEN